jgi:hypothetical protein
MCANNYHVIKKNCESDWQSFIFVSDELYYLISTQSSTNPAKHVLMRAYSLDDKRIDGINRPSKVDIQIKKTAIINADGCDEYLVISVDNIFAEPIKLNAIVSIDNILNVCHGVIDIKYGPMTMCYNNGVLEIRSHTMECYMELFIAVDLFLNKLRISNDRR